MSPLFIILNGPPGSGKTTQIARMICQTLREYIYKEFYEGSTDLVKLADMQQHANNSVAQDSFAAPMKHFISVILGTKYTELKKDVELAVLYGYTPRRFLQLLSEDHIKPLYGVDFFGRAMLHRTVRLDPMPRWVVIDDSGFQDEIDPLAKRLLIRVERPGYDFEGDTRTYLEYPDYTIVNDGDLDSLLTKVQLVCSHIIGHPKNNWNA